jgi:hypothetical protein
MLGKMGTGGRVIGLVLWLGAVFVSLEARAGGGGGPFLVFDASAERLPREEIRAAVERELGGPLSTSSDSASGEITILVDSERRLVVRYRTPSGAVERYLPMPSEPSDVSLIVSLAVGNLVRDQAVVGEPSNSARETSAKPVEPAASKTADSPPPMTNPVVREGIRHWVGVHVAQDIAFVYGDDVCDQVAGRSNDFYCYYPGSSDEPFFHDPQPDSDFEEGPAFATTRFLISYDYVVFPWLSVGGRLGYAFGGGPPTDQLPDEEPPNGDRNLIPANMFAYGGESFLPLHAELRGSYWFLPLSRNSVGAYVGAGFGVAQVDTKSSRQVYDCAQTLDPSWDPADGTLDDCMQRSANLNPAALTTTRLDVWKKMGHAFVTGSVGVKVPVKDDLSAVANVNAMYMFPLEGFVLEPSIGLMLGL